MKELFIYKRDKSEEINIINNKKKDKEDNKNKKYKLQIRKKAKQI